MRTRNSHIQVIAWYQNEVKIIPLRFKLGQKKINVDRIMSTETQKQSGEIIHTYHCASLIDGHLEQYKLKYLVSKPAWFFSMQIDD